MQSARPWVGFGRLLWNEGLNTRDDAQMRPVASMREGCQWVLVWHLHEVPWVRDLVGCLSTHKYAAKTSLEGTVIATQTAVCIIRALPPQLQNSGKLSQASLRSRTQLHENVSHDRLRICFFEPSLMLLLFVTHSSIVAPPLDDVFFFLPAVCQDSVQMF